MVAVESMITVSAGEMTSSHLPTPAAARAQCSVAVPEFMATAYFTPNFSQNALSRALFHEPPVEDQLSEFRTFVRYSISLMSASAPGRTCRDRSRVSGTVLSAPQAGAGGSFPKA